MLSIYMVDMGAQGRCVRSRLGHCKDRRLDINLYTLPFSTNIEINSTPTSKAHIIAESSRSVPAYYTRGSARLNSVRP